uniref:Protein SDA1 n=1 Tax=Sus scrofa TaxID=9823 RepID=A0A8D1ESW3_PIG
LVSFINHCATIELPDLKSDQFNFIFLQFLQQYNHYKSNVEIFKLQPNKPSKELAELVMFMAQVRQFLRKTSEEPLLCYRLVTVIQNI